MPHDSAEETRLSDQYQVAAQHGGDLKRQFEQISKFETAAASGDWNLFKEIVNRNGGVFLKLMRRADGDPRLSLPLFQSGELEDSFTGSLKKLGKTWIHLLPWWARLAYSYEVALSWTSAGFALGAVGASISGSPGVGGVLGAVALAILIIVDNSEPGLRSYSRWWVRLIYLKPKSLLRKWRTAIYAIAILMIMWSMLADTFKTPQEYCEGLSPADLAALNGCVEVIQGRE
ncbi:MAG: hypothetical protein O3B95_08320 [Chloroflexi bacterium]|nr:hypothetical protein [Chloroflexota bacterium]